MRFRRLLGAGLGALGLVAAGTAALERRAGDPGPSLQGTERTHRWRGMEISYAEAGDPDDPTLLCLHGINAVASAYEFDRVFQALATDHHVVAPDLPGFGRSDRPPVDYDATLYVDFVREFSRQVTPGATCLASSLTGGYAALAQRETGAFSRLVLVCPTATTTAIRRPRLRALLRSPVVGTALFYLLASEVSIRHFSATQAFYLDGAIDPDDVDYWWRTAHQPGARFAPASFVSGYLDPDADLGGVLAGIDVPVTLVWGREAEITPLSYGRDLAEAGDAGLVVFDRARLLPHVEHAERFVEVLDDGLTTASTA